MSPTKPANSKYADEILGNLREDIPEMTPATRPGWLLHAKWHPELFFRMEHDRRCLAVDIIPSALIPRTQFRKEVKGLLDKHSNLRVVVCVLEDGFRDNPETKAFCRKLGIGLKILTPGIGLQSVVRTDLDGKVIRRVLPEEKGWFPSAILNEAKGLKRVMFGKEVDDFVSKVANLADNEEEVRKLAFDTIDKLLRQHPSFKGNFGRFMRLDRFERLLKSAGVTSSDHVFHSLRVFLAGCPIIERFYDAFEKAHRRYCIGGSKMRVEYSWLLTAIFHDIGRPAEGAPEFISGQLEDEFVEVRSRPERWQQDRYKDALRILGSFAGFTALAKDNECWDGGIVEDDYCKKVYVDWIGIYDQLAYHGIMSAVEFLADIVEKMKAADQRAYRPFVFTHAVPAALSILLHDWRIWKPHAKKWRLYPVNATVLPLAALLIYLDTWDDYKRKKGGPKIQVKSYAVDDEGAQVTVKWADSESLKKEEKKYRAFKKALTRRLFGLVINAE